MNVHRWCPYVGAAFLTLFMLLGASAVYASMSMEISPQQPIVWEPITFTVQTGTADGAFFFGVWSEVRVNGIMQGCPVTNFSESAPVYSTTQSITNGGNLTVTLAGGLPAGSYAIAVLSTISNGPSGCWEMQVIP